MRFPSCSVSLLIISSFTSPVQPQPLAPETPCPLLGPDLPTPKNLSSSPVIQAALKNLTALLQCAISTGNSTHGAVPLNTTSFGLSIFSLDESSNSSRLFEFHQTSPTLANVTSGVHQVDANSIYRVGSMSMLITTYTFLIESGYTHWFDPVTKWVPELAAAAKGHDTPQQDAIDAVQWNDVTLADLLSQMSGIGRENAVFDLSFHLTPAELQEAGLPPLNSSQIPSYGVDPFCDRAAFFTTFTERHPVFLTTTTPVYSNMGFQILAYALEAITGQPFKTSLTEKVLKPLGMNSTNLGDTVPTDSSHGVIPINQTVSYWGLPAGDEAPGGGMYMSLNDLTKLGISILSSNILPAAMTRRWLKPVAHLSNLLNSVGAPWEISRAVTAPNDRVVDYYTKSGNLGFYYSILALSRDYNMGFSILAAGEDSSLVISTSILADLIGDTVLPALEVAAQQQAVRAFVGVYTSAPNCSLTLASDDFPGLAITSWTSNSTDELAAYASLQGIPSAELRLYPTNLVSSSATETRIAWRMLLTEPSSDTGVFSLGCTSWGNLDNPIYAAMGVDEFDFTAGLDGVAKSVTLPAFRQTLLKTSS